MYLGFFVFFFIEVLLGCVLERWWRGKVIRFFIRVWYFFIRFWFRGVLGSKVSFSVFFW